MTELYIKYFNQIKKRMVSSIRHLLFNIEDEVIFKVPFKYDGVYCIGLKGYDIMLINDEYVPMEKLNETELLYILEQIEKKHYIV